MLNNYVETIVLWLFVSLSITLSRIASKSTHIRAIILLIVYISALDEMKMVNHGGSLCIILQTEINISSELFQFCFHLDK